MSIISLSTYPNVLE